MLPAGAGAGPLEQLRQQGEDDGRVAAGGRRLAGGQADLALGHRHAGEAVHHQHHVLALVAEPLGDPGGHEARRAAARRGGASEVATTTTERARPSGPRSFSMNSRTSRPRSPTSAITETSASVPRVIIDSRLDLPTPEPAKMPMRWPRPHGHERVEGAYAEAELVVDQRAARAAPGASSSTPTSARRVQRRAAVDRAAEAVEDAAAQRRRRPRIRSGPPV